MKDSRSWSLALVLALLGVSVGAYRWIPGWERPWGLDLDNVYVFHACSSRDDPYLATGPECHDPIGRAMPYPPLLYWMLSWMRLVTFPQARWIWASCIVAILVWVAVLWSRATRSIPQRWIQIAFGLFLVAEYPATFAIQRGNNDAVVVLLWTIAMALYLRERHGASGFAAGLAVAAKLYPGFGCVVLVAGGAGIALHEGNRRLALRLVAGLVLAPALALCVFWTQTRHYVDKVLPTSAAHLPSVSLHSHSVPANFGAFASAASAALVLAWAFAAFRRMGSAPFDVFAGGLALSTYVARTSFDYNLVTTYPLLIVLCGRALGARGRESVAWFVVLVLGLFAVVGYRGWFEGHPIFHARLQVFWLLAAAALVAKLPSEC